jgi:hypothetical protein
MRVRSLSMSWFRGSADSVSLDLNEKSAVIYGTNGAGKSSFVDVVEYAMTGKVGHLAHEYSGKRQEKALINTHIPKGMGAEVRITFRDQSETKLSIDKSGNCERTESATVDISTWSLRRTILRQDEVAEFIRETKGAKYSALLPLLGLGPIEIAAENLRQLSRSIDSQSKRQTLRAEINEIDGQRKAQFGSDDDNKVRAALVELQGKYGLASSGAQGSVAICEELAAEIDRRVKASSSHQRQFIGLSEIGRSLLEENIAALRVANSQLADAVEPMLVEKLEVLRSADHFASGLTGTKQLKCPACGQSVSRGDFEVHVSSEQQRLHEMIKTFDARRLATDALVHTIRNLKSRINSDDVKTWRDEAKNGLLSAPLSYLATVDSQVVSEKCNESVLAELERHFMPLITTAAAQSSQAPPDAAELSIDKEIVGVARTMFGSEGKAEELSRADSLVAFIKALEGSVRDEIRRQAESVISAISTDIQAMWGILHPDKWIKNVRLYVPDDADKAIDIGLQFHGVTQASPRLTLSEGYRNSLGLCIFLAMAKRESSTDRPLLLDDVVVSLDRNHRGMIVELLENEFANRQVIVLTHDRDWYAELRQQLDSKRCSFQALVPYESPTMGIRWSKSVTTFDDARSRLKDRPDSAGNDARKIMDVELALVADRLQIRLPYRRGDNNDKRTAHDFLERLMADGKDGFQVKVDGKWEPHKAALEKFEAADRLMITWGNRASHSFDLVRPEATKLIGACEEVVESFRCASCKKPVWHAAIGGGKSWQCECGQLRWR